VRIGTSAIVGNTYSWSPKTNIADTSIVNPYVNPLTTTTYTLTTKDKKGCVGTDQVTVTVTVGKPNAGLDLTACLQVDSIALKLPANGESYVAVAGNPSITKHHKGIYGGWNV
jgi:hypothetical protein